MTVCFMYVRVYAILLDIFSYCYIFSRTVTYFLVHSHINGVILLSLSGARQLERDGPADAGFVNDQAAKPYTVSYQTVYA
jgi:hypothetical protein